MEDELLAALEELAQNTDVFTHWADEMYDADQEAEYTAVTYVAVYMLLMSFS